MKNSNRIDMRGPNAMHKRPAPHKELENTAPPCGAGAFDANIRNHDFKPVRAGGYTWSECSKCHATRHSGFFWLHGWKSKTEPPCEVESAIEKWRITAEPMSDAYYDS